jgi:hypothetical protein
VRSCLTSAYLGIPRGSLTRCKAYSRSAVTAEAAGSSPVVPAIHSKPVNEWCFHSSLPTISPTPSLEGLPLESHRVEELVLSGDRLLPLAVNALYTHALVVIISTKRRFGREEDHATNRTPSKRITPACVPIHRYGVDDMMLAT